VNYDFSFLEAMIDELRANQQHKRFCSKTEIIKEFIASKTNGDFLKRILLYTYHPLWTYGVTSDNLKKKSHLRGVLYSDFFELLDDLKNRKLTGHDAIGAVNSFIDDLDENFRDSYSASLIKI
jgi:DNA-binding ferritin-like protein (Dps family)